MEVEPMDQNQRELRRAASEAFMESLEQLQETLKPNDYLPAELSKTGSRSSSENGHSNHTSPSFDLTLFEQAAADIEQFLQNEK